jgi:hypothetical protein
MKSQPAILIIAITVAMVTRQNKVTNTQRRRSLFRIAISAEIFALITVRRNTFHELNMFSDESFEAVGFRSCWKIER